MRVLLVEDDSRVAHFVAKGLREQSYAVDVSEDGDDALYQSEINSYDLIILDVMIPGRNGFEVCREIRNAGKRTPILMLTARDAVEDRILGLDHGADDYLTKPFEFRELLARLRALLRRSSELRPASIVIDDLVMDTAAQAVSRGGRPITLTAKEYALLEFLARNAGRVVGRAEIAEHVWDETFDAFSNLIEVYINRLRGKIDGKSARPLLHTRRGSGYQLVVPEPRQLNEAKEELNRQFAGSTQLQRRKRIVLDSVRVRLTFWYGSVLAIFLIVLSAVSYFIFWRSSVARSESDLVELSNAFLVTLRSELEDAPGPQFLKQAADETILEHRFRDHSFVMLNSAGQIVASSDDLANAITPEHSATELANSKDFRRFMQSGDTGDRSFTDVEVGHRHYRCVVRTFSTNGGSYNVAIFQSSHPQNEMLEEIQVIFAWIIPLAIILASTGGYFLARKSLAPVMAMSRQANSISAANLHDRLPVGSEKDELGALAAAFNNLLDRLDQSFERQRRFMADASHELRTPIAILRGEAEVSLSQVKRQPEEYRESLTVLHQEAQRLTHIVEDLFTLTRADAGQYPIQQRDFYLDELVLDCAHSARTLAGAKNIKLTCEANEECPMFADEPLLRRMILNLIDNAIKYTPTFGNITVACKKEGQNYEISFADSGPGIPLDLQPRIFERFFRVDAARSRNESDSSGAGLGLSIARWIAEAHHGRLELVRSDAQGSIFSAFLPANRKVEREVTAGAVNPSFKSS